MDIRSLELLIEQAYGNGGRNSDGTLDNLRKADSRWSIGIRLFVESNSPVSKFFGLSLVRDFMSSNIGSNRSQEWTEIRNWIVQWVSENISMFPQLETFIVNNLVSIMVLTIKATFPEIWPSAFQDLLALGVREACALDFVVRVLAEIDVEVVMYNVERTPSEIQHNTLIKDTIRERNIAQDLVVFLCTSTISIRPIDTNLSTRCLQCLSELIGWIDLSLILNAPVLSIIYKALSDKELFSASCSCLLQIVRKGMDPISKVKMLQTSNIIQILCALPFSTTPKHKNQNIDNDNDTNDDDEVEVEEEDMEDELAPIVDAVVLELVECYAIYEDTTDIPRPDIISVKDIEQYSKIAAELLHTIMPLLLRLFIYSSTSIAALFPSENKNTITSTSINGSSSYSFLFDTKMYLNDFLQAIFVRMEYEDEDFSFDGDNDEDIEEMECRKEIRRIFVNISRIYPEPCLQLLASAFSNLPQPLSTSPFPPLEAALRLLHAIGEAGPKHLAGLSEHYLPALLSALHKSDVGLHPHTEVLLAYFEICARYAPMNTPDDLRHVVSVMTGPSGLRNSVPQVRSRCAYFLLKLCESLSNRAVVLLPAVGSFADILLYKAGDSGPLSEQAEVHILEAVALMTAAVAPTADSTPDPVAAQVERDVISQRQKQLLLELTSTLLMQLTEILSHPQLMRYADQMAPAVAHKLSCLGSLARPFSHKSVIHSHARTAFEGAVAGLEGALKAFNSFPVVRGKAVALQHRLIACLGAPSLRSAGPCLAALLSGRAEGELDSAIMLLNKLMVEFQKQTLGLVNEALGLTLDRLGEAYGQASLGVARTNSSDGSIEGGNGGGGGGETSSSSIAPHVAVERDSILKQYLLLLQHICDCQCSLALSSTQNAHRVPEVLSVLMQGLELKQSQSSQRSSDSSEVGLGVRRGAVGTCASMLKVWGARETGPTVCAEQHVVCTEQHIQEIRQMFSKTLLDQIFPSIISSLGNGSLNMSDASIMSYLGDIASLIWVYREIRGIDELMNYIQGLLQALRWSEVASKEFLQLLREADQNKNHTGVFRDAFRKLIRSLYTRSTMSV
eukprot:gene123-184_t